MQVEVVRELNPTDLALLQLERGIKAPAIKNLRDSHHAIARCIAEGKSGVETQYITGYSASRISILKDDPAFKELVEFYKSKTEEIKDQAAIDHAAKMAALHSDILDEISDRLHESPEKIAFDELITAGKFVADRTGHGPQSKSTNLNLNLDLAARVASGRQRAQRLLSAPADASAARGEAVPRTPSSPPLDVEFTEVKK